MEVFNNYKKYRQHTAEYAVWKDAQNTQEAKRIEYLKQNPDKINQEDIKRAHSLLRAIDTMDEYSQSKAEDMEVATEIAVSQAVSLAIIAFGTLGLLSYRIPSVNKFINSFALKNPKLGMLASFLPTAIGSIAGLIASVPLISWAASKQVGASRKGRFEAMRNDLQHPNNFAILTDEQLEKVKQEAKNIPVTDEMKKSIKKRTMNAGLFDSFKAFKEMVKGDKEYEKQKAEFEKTLNEHEKNFDIQLSESDIQKAKRDQQILTKAVEKIDIASQDYAENVELVTNIAQMFALGGGVLTGWLTDKLVKLLKTNPQNKVAKGAKWAVGISTVLVFSTIAAKLQKQASRVGRFNAKQEFLNNPESLVYVDDEKINSIDAKKLPEKKKPNFFKFMIQAFKDNRRYTKHIKENGIEEKKFNKALENIALSDEQIKEAKALQINTFKTFNKVDEKSQTYSESVEAVGNMFQQLLGMVSPLLGMGIGLLFAKKDLSRMLNGTITKQKSLPVMLKMGAGLFAGLIPIIASEIYITREQKKASRVADMLAIKELGDYRHYADYDNLQKTNATKENITSDKIDSDSNPKAKNKSLLELLADKSNIKPA